MRQQRGKISKRGRRRAARSIENPAVPLGSDESFDLLGGGRSSSGVRVSRTKALGYPAVWRAVSLITGDVGKLPLVVYRQSGKNKEPDPKHPAYRVLLRKPNEAMTAFAFKQTLMLHALIHGNGYAYIDRDGAGRVEQLLILDPESVEPMRVGGALWYFYWPLDGGPLRRIAADEILHIKGLGYDGLKGYPVLKIARDALGAAIAARDHSAKYFGNSARPGGVLEHPGKLSDVARRNMRESWERTHKGLENQHKIAILEEGVKYTGFSSTARDSQLLETREFDAREVANIFGVPTHKLGDPSKVAYNSLGEENQSYYDDTLSRWLKVFAEEAHDKLLSEEEKASESHCVDFDYQEIQRANLPAQVDFVDKLVKAGIINQDEGRGVFGYNPLPDGKGQRYFIPSTLVPIDDAGKTAPSGAADSQPEPARKAAPPGLAAVIEDVAGRMVRRLSTQADRAKADLAAWLRDGIRGQRDTLAEAFGPVVAVARDFGFAVRESGAVADQLIDSFVASYGNHAPIESQCVQHVVTFLTGE